MKERRTLGNIVQAVGVAGACRVVATVASYFLPDSRH